MQWLKIAGNLWMRLPQDQWLLQNFGESYINQTANNNKTGKPNPAERRCCKTDIQCTQLWLIKYQSCFLILNRYTVHRHFNRLSLFLIINRYINFNDCSRYFPIQTGLKLYLSSKGKFSEDSKSPFFFQMLVRRKKQCYFGIERIIAPPPWCGRVTH